MQDEVGDGDEYEITRFVGAIVTVISMTYRFKALEASGKLISVASGSALSLMLARVKAARSYSPDHHAERQLIEAASIQRTAGMTTPVPGRRLDAEGR